MTARRGAADPARELVTGPEARVPAACPGGGADRGWLGVALDDGEGATLFPEEGRAGRRRRFRRRGRCRRGCGAGGPAGAAGARPCLRAGRQGAAAGHLSRGRCGGPSHPLDAIDPARLFGCDVAAYLLGSNRSGYEIESLAEEYLGRRLEAGDSATSRAVAHAAAAAELHPVLADRLEADGSRDCFERIEMPLVPVLVRMEQVGVGVDTSVLAALGGDPGSRASAWRTCRECGASVSR